MNGRGIQMSRVQASELDGTKGLYKLCHDWLVVQCEPLPGVMQIMRPVPPTRQIFRIHLHLLCCDSTALRTFLLIPLGHDYPGLCI